MSVNFKMNLFCLSPGNLNYAEFRLFGISETVHGGSPAIFFFNKAILPLNSFSYYFTIMHNRYHVIVYSPESF